ncbi:hypothetical protein P3G55_15135 [Leptospira sp. 96542]|nr:hypothetical protein [Leptospira sp. 96542]
MNQVDVLKGLKYNVLSETQERSLAHSLNVSYTYNKIDYSKAIYYEEYENVEQINEDKLILKSWNSDYYYLFLLSVTEDEFSFSARMSELYPYIIDIISNSTIDHFFYCPEYDILIEASLFKFETIVSQGLFT